MIERRNTAFIEKLSVALVIIAALGGFLVLIDPVIAFTTASGVKVTLGGTGFGDQLKGAVIQTILFGGFTGAVGYWLGAAYQPKTTPPPEEEVKP